MEETELITLHNSNPLYKYPVDADQLNYNFKLLKSLTNVDSIKTLVESTGQTFSTLFVDQLAKAVAQYALSASVFSEEGENNTFILHGKDGLSAPVKYADGMIVSFRPTHSNTGPITIQIDNLNPYQVLLDGTTTPTTGFITVGTLMSFRFVENDGLSYWDQLSYSGNGGSNGGGSSSEDPALDYAYKSIINLITSAGIAVDSANKTLLSEAVTKYIANMMYDSNYDNGTYYLTTKNNQIGFKEPTEGMIIFFVADAPNAANATISLNGGYQSSIMSYDNNPIAANALLAGDFVYCIYTNGVFKLYSNHHATLSLNTGVTVDTISNDGSLVNDSSRTLPTEHAVKAYVDAKVKGTIPNIVVDGYTESGNPAALNNIGGHIIQIVTRSSEEQYGVKEVQPSNPNYTAASSNVAYKHNIINKLDDTYWLSATTGYKVDGKQRTLAGVEGAKYVVVDTDSSGNPIYLTDPEYIEVSHVYTYPNVLKIKHSTQNTTPQEIKIQIAFGSDNTYYDLVDSQTTPVTYEYGNLAAKAVDDAGYYHIEMPLYYLNGSSVSTVTIAAGSYCSLRIIAISFDNQFPTTEDVNATGYDPNNDTTSTQYPWQVVDVVCVQNVESPVFTLVYPDSSVETITNQLNITQYEVVEDSLGEITDPNLTALSEVDDGTYYIYKIYGNPILGFIDYDSVYTQITDPFLPEEKTEETLGSIWINPSTLPNKTYILTTDSVDYYWEEVNLMFLGAAVYSNDAITSLDTFRYMNSLGVEYAMTPDFDQTITHNFGTDVRVQCQLICETDNSGYVAGEKIAVDNNISITTTNVLSYFQVANTKLTTRITAGNLLLVNRDLQTVVTLPSTGWRLRVYIIKD